MNSYPLPVKRALKKIGVDISQARRRRRISTTLMAERASVSRMTISKVEKGDGGVSLGTYAKILFVLGMIDRLNDLVDVRFDDLGLELEAEKLPKRIRKSKKK